MGSYFDPKLIVEFLPDLLKFFPITLGILIGAILLGGVLASIVASFRILNVPVLNQLSVVYISFMRGTPTIIQLFLVYYGLPILLQMINIDVSGVSEIVFVIIAYALGIGAFLAEIIRGAINSVDNGQKEAAYSVGMKTYQVFIRIIIPQALIVAIPNFTNLLISYLKETSLAFMLGVVDMVGRASALGNLNYHYLEIYIGLTIIYYVVCIFIQKGLSIFEFRITKHEQHLAKG
ncbi:amino acid ABC transporter permease [Clostridium sp. DL1XJH146]